MNVAIILNGAAGLQPTSRERLDAALGRYPTVAWQVMVCRRPQELPAQVASVLTAGAQVVVAAGGDGTVSTVARALVDREVDLGILPLGTLNHFARDLGIPLGLEDALAVIVAGDRYRVDVAEVNGRVFVNNASLGLYPAALRYRDRWRRRLGKWPAMVLAWLLLALWLPRQRLHLYYGDQHLRGVYPLVFIGNNRYRYHFPEPGRRRYLNAGLLDVVFLEKAPLRRLLATAWQILRGRMKEAEGLGAAMVTTLIVRGRRRRIHLGLDGENCRFNSPLRFRIRSAALAVRVPQQRENS